jgi:diguanylate cyclase (GGDEF)-like protein
MGFAAGLAATCAFSRWRYGLSLFGREQSTSLRHLRDIACRVNVQVSEHTKYVEDVQRGLEEATEGQGDGQAVVAAAEALRLANERMRSELMRARLELEEQAEQLESHRRAARTDGLTRLLNRRAFDEEMQQLPARLLRSVTDATLFLIDIDHFKSLNDRYGHPLGDEVLSHVAGILRQSVLGLDAVVARYGGDEFAVICTNSSLPAAARLAEDVRQAIERMPIFHAGADLSITVSVGLGHSENGMYPYDTLARADEALYVAKNAGRNRTCYHNGAECLTVAELLGNPCSEARTRPRDVSLESTCSLASQSKGRERRQQTRGRHRRHHPIAPLINGRVPTSEMYFRAWFFDISAAGFGMLLPTPPTAKFFAVALDENDPSRLVTAEVVRLRRSTEQDDTGWPYWEVGCRILGKLPVDQPDFAEAVLV